MAKPTRETLKGESCYICGYDNRHALEEHHLIPQSIGGSDSDKNTVTLCSNCHSAISSFYDRWFFKQLWDIFEDMDHPPDFVKQNPPKGLKYNDNNRLVPDLENGFRTVVKAIELLDRGMSPRDVSKQCDLGESTARDIRDDFENRKEMYYEFLDTGEQAKLSTIREWNPDY